MHVQRPDCVCFSASPPNQFYVPLSIGLDGIKVTRMKVVGSIDEEESLTEVKPVVKKSKPKIVKF